MRVCSIIETNKQKLTTKTLLRNLHIIRPLNLCKTLSTESILIQIQTSGLRFVYVMVSTLRYFGFPSTHVLTTIIIITTLLSRVHTSYGQ